LQPIVACVLAPHVEQEALPSTLLAYWFKPQGTQTEEEVAPSFLLAVPIGQGVHDAWPCKIAYEPALHKPQVEDPSSLAKRPASQSEQACVEEGEKLPTLQGVHAVAPGNASVLVKLPALQDMQAMVELTV